MKSKCRNNEKFTARNSIAGKFDKRVNNEILLHSRGIRIQRSTRM